jgi:hypothetical protein
MSFKLLLEGGEVRNGFGYIGLRDLMWRVLAIF